MPKAMRYGLVILMALFMVGCAYDQPTEEMANKPPEGAHIQYAPELKLGDTWIFEQHNHQAADPYARWEEKVVELLPNNEYVIQYTDLEKSVSRLLIRDQHLNAVATLNPANGERTELKAVQHKLQFPLWEGKSWRLAFKVAPAGGGRINEFDSTFTVTGMGRIRLMGVFHDAILIERKDIIHGGGKSDENARYWYVPQFKCKAKFLEKDAVDMELVDFIPGPAQ